MTTHPNKEQYYTSEGLPQAVRLFDELYSRKRHGVTLSMSIDQLRQHLEKLPGNTVMPAALTALWLDLSQKEERERRKTEPPKNPFGPDGKAKKATKEAILKWEAAWRLKRVMSEGAQAFQRSGSEKVKSTAQTLHAKLLWVIENGDVLGWIGELPTEAIEKAVIGDLDIKAMTLHNALLKPWQDPQEQVLWAKRFRAGNRLLEKEVENKSLAALAMPRHDKPAPPGQL